MIHELVYTSVPQGLKPGTSGFCVVAMSRNMHPLLVQHLERMSGYRHLNAPGASNPVAKSFACATIQGKSYFILSRIADAGLDYSGRSNHIAHHIVIESVSELSAGPAYYLGRDDLFYAHWTGQPRFLAPRELPPAQVNAKPCVRWQSVTGDAGWATAPIESGFKGKTSTLIVRTNVDSLSLIAETLALLPTSERWKNTFSTYYTKPVADTEFQWRFVFQDTPESKSRETNFNSVIDLTAKLESARGQFADEARNGRAIRLEGNKSEKRNLAKETSADKSAEKSQTESGIAKARSADRARGELKPWETSEPPLYPRSSSQRALTSELSNRRLKSSSWKVAIFFALGITIGGIIVAITLIPWNPKATSQALRDDSPKPPENQGDPSDFPKKNDDQHGRSSPKRDGEQAHQSTPEVPPTPPKETSELGTSGGAVIKPIDAIPPALPPTIELATALKNFREVFGRELVWDLKDKDPVALKSHGLTAEAMGKFEIKIHNPLEEKIQYLWEKMPAGEEPTYWKFSYQTKQGKDETGESIPQELGRIYFYEPTNINWAWEPNMTEKVGGQAFLFCQMEFSLPPDPTGGSLDEAQSDSSFTVKFRNPAEVSLTELLDGGFDWILTKGLVNELKDQVRFRNVETFPLNLSINEPSIELPSRNLGEIPSQGEIYEVAFENAIHKLSESIRNTFIEKATVEYELETSSDDVRPISNVASSQGISPDLDAHQPIRIQLKPILKIWFKKNPPELPSSSERKPDTQDELTFGEKTKSPSHNLNYKPAAQASEPLLARRTGIEIVFKNKVPNFKKELRTNPGIYALAVSMKEGLNETSSKIRDAGIEKLIDDFCKQITDHHASWNFDLVIGEGDSIVSVIHVGTNPPEPTK